MQLRALKSLLIILPLIFSLTLMLRDVNLPYVGPNATDLNTLSLAARNYNNFGFLDTKFAIIKSLSPNLSKQDEIYLHHPMLMVIGESILFKFLGYGFWVGRITVIIPAFLAFVLIFMLAKELKNKKIASWTLILATLTPAFIVFGRTMHFPGSWAMFFILLIAYFTLRFIKTNRKIFFYAAAVCVVLGTLSDWPITFFTVFLLPLLIKNKKKKEGVLLILVSALTAFMFLAYAFLILGNFKYMSDAFINRSVGQLLLSLPFWPVNWISIILLRFLIYFNPIFVFACLIYIFRFIKRYFAKKLNNFDFIVFAFFATGMTQIVLYPEGSFGHPFWIYLLSPFIALAGTDILYKKFEKNIIAIVLLLFFSLIFLLRIEDWKTKQNEAELYRYDLAKQTSIYFKPYEKLAINPDSYINSDLLTYSFYQNSTPINLPTDNFKGANLYVYTCIGCDLNNKNINFLANQYKFKKFDAIPGTIYVFFLKEKQTQHFGIQYFETTKKIIPKPSIKQNFLRNMYINFIDFLKVPQI